MPRTGTSVDMRFQYDRSGIPNPFFLYVLNMLWYENKSPTIIQSDLDEKLCTIVFDFHWVFTNTARGVDRSELRIIIGGVCTPKEGTF